MSSIIVGTAGHIDHGKSALVRALTGTDPDRLKEEKERGITIDLGFAHMDLGGGSIVSFIDVPGHERFVRHMLAGAHGIDAVALVVAADESVMPQTREHFHICRLLGVPRGLVVLTKCDAADLEMQALAELEVRELVAGSFLEGAPVLRVSARTGEGLDALRAALKVLAQQARHPHEGGLLRLPVDRVFTLRGFGTVVTGTLVSGRVAVGDEVEILPGGRRSRVRGLQVHGEPVSDVGAGHRAAANLADVEVADVSRGDVLARTGTLRATSLLDVHLSLLAGGAPLLDDTRLRVHVKSAEVLGRVRLLGAKRLDAGASLPARLRLETPCVAGRGDRLILRTYSPPSTIGGAVVLDPVPQRRRKGSLAVPPPTDEPLETAAVRMVAEAGPAGIEASLLAARLTMAPDALAGLVARLPEVVAVGGDRASYLGTGAVRALADETCARLSAFHRDQPLRAAMPREELRRRVFARAPDGVFEKVVGLLADEGRVRRLPDAVALFGHEVRLTSEEQEARRRILGVCQAAGLQGLDPAAADTGMDRRLVERVAGVLVAEGTLGRVGDLLVHGDHLAALKDEVRRRWPPGSRLDVASFKDLTGLSRKFVIPLLEFLDRERVTRRAGNDRLVLS